MITLLVQVSPIVESNSDIGLKTETITKLRHGKIGNDASLLELLEGNKVARAMQLINVMMDEVANTDASTEEADELKHNFSLKTMEDLLLVGNSYLISLYPGCQNVDKPHL